MIKEPFEIRASLLARNTILNLIGQAVPLFVAVVTIPFIVRGLGTERFGLLSLAWVVLGYFTIFDLGLGRATTKFIAEALGRGEEDQMPRLVWTAVTVQTVLGLLGALVLVGITPLLVERILNISQTLVSEAKAVFYLLALSIPMVLVSGSFSGVLEANQRFDLVNTVRIPSSSLTFLLPLVGLLLGFQLPGIVALILITRFGALSVLIVLVLRIFPKLRKFSAYFVFFPRLLSFGGWVMVSSIVGPILVYLDRFLIGSLLSMTAIAYYSTPYDAVTRLGIIPTSLAMALFPAFSALRDIKNSERFGTLFARSIKYVLLALGPVVLVIGLFAKDILQIWLGTDFAIESTTVLQILSLGILINSLAHTPFALLQGIGRPDLPAKFHLLELPLYVGGAWLLIGKWGIAGAAGAWTLRVALDALLLFVAAFKVCQFSPHLLATNGVMFTSMAILLLASMAYGLKSITDVLPLSIQFALFVALFSLFAWLVWRKVLDALDKDMVLKVVKPWLGSKSTL